MNRMEGHHDSISVHELIKQIHLRQMKAKLFPICDWVGLRCAMVRLFDILKFVVDFKVPTRLPLFVKEIRKSGETVR